MAEVEGRATAITVLTPIRPWHTLLLRLVFWLGAHLSFLTRKLEQLSFIHFARWAIVTRIPADPTAEPERLRYRYLLFESNFNGTWDQYIDAFSEVVPLRMKVIWGNSFGFPGPVPVGPFKRYIRRNQLPIAHFYSAYPGATTTEIASALEIERRFGELAAQARGLEAGSFQVAYEAFLAEVQGHL